MHTADIHFGWADVPSAVNPRNVQPSQTLRLNRAARLLISLILMAILPLQGMSACALSARGPLHIHTAISQDLVLEDFRRAPSPAPAGPVHVAIAFGHFHAAGTPLRHYHGLDSASVMTVDDGGIDQAGNAGSLFAGHGAGAIDGIPAAGIDWLAEPGTRVRATHVAWICLTFEPEPFERPPRPA